MQTYPVFFHDWHGQAFRQDGHWHFAPKTLSDHLNLDWRVQHRKITTSNLAKGMVIMTIPSAGGPQETLMLKQGYFGAWLLSINEGKVNSNKRPLVIQMQDALLDALERQLGQMFGLPLMEAEEFLRLPVPGWTGLTAEDCRSAREKVTADHQCFTAARLMKVGLAASRVAPLVNRSVYWARQQQRRFRAIGMVPPTPAQQRLLDQLDLFGNA